MKTKIMGILNVTPDSFSDGGDYFDNPEKAVKRVDQMLSDGADYIDIGGESTRPGSEYVSEKEELDRVLPIIKALRKKHGDDIRISIDTWKSSVATEALKNGANAVNSLGGFLFDEELAEVVAKYHCMIIIYHIKGEPKTMQKGEITYTNVSREIGNFFEQQIEIGQRYGIKRDQFILDPGIGFGKTGEQNIEIIKNLSYFKKFALPLLLGVSRKSHLGTILKNDLNLETQPIERLEASLAETAIAVQNGAGIIRTHDVRETKKFLSILEKFLD
jgi:dihydropteroate synthase